MNPTEYANKMITVDPLAFQPEVPITEAATVAVRWGYPEPRYGVTLYSGKRGRTNDGIDWGVDHLRQNIADLIVNVAEDCISITSEVLDSDIHAKVASLIRNHFEIRIN
jgi:hypothetical protein